MSTSNLAAPVADALATGSQVPIPDTWDEQAALGKHCLRVRKVADLTFARVCQAMLAGPGSKSQRDVAEALECSQKTVSQAVAALAMIANDTEGISGDLEPAYDDAMREVREPKRSAPSAGPPFNPDEFHNLQREVDEFNAGGKSAPALSITADESARDWIAALDKGFALMTERAQSLQKSETRQAVLDWIKRARTQLDLIEGSLR